MRKVLVALSLILAVLLCSAGRAGASGDAAYRYTCWPAGGELTIVSPGGDAYVVRGQSGTILATGVAGPGEWAVPIAPTEFHGVWVTMGGQSTWVANDASDAWWE